MNLAELKLFLREEHLQARSVQTRLKRSFGTAFGEDSSNQTTSPPDPTATAAAKSTPTAEVSNAQDASTPQGDNVAESISHPSIRGIVQGLIQSVEIDNSKPADPSPGTLSIPIKDLFDFTQTYWVQAYDKLAMRGLQDELELYELLDLDAEGDTIENEADDVLNE